ncbi:MAG: NAD(P)/FAD-dependent oxidoreductase [Planctomycetota bacterium]
MRTDVLATDVLVVGAGPAGSALALQLRRDGYDVVLADKKAFPRDKPCGEFLSPQCQPLLEEMGLGSVMSDLGAHEVLGMRLHHRERRASGGFRQVADADATPRGFGIRRSVFDHALFREAVRSGVHAHTRHAFDSLLRDSHGRVVGARLRPANASADAPPVEVRARFVVGADGVHSRVAHALRLQKPIRWLQQFALVAHFQGVAPREQAEVHLLRGGFFAATTVDAQQFGVNLVLPRAQLATRPPGASWDAFVASYLAQAPAFAERLEGAQRLNAWHGSGPFAYRTTRQSVPGAALVGDAAGYVDPLTGEGIYFALFTAQALAKAVHRSLQKPGDEGAAMAAYARARQHELGPRLRAAMLLQRGLRSPWVTRRFVGAMGRWSGFADLVVTMSGDTVHPRQLWRPSFWRSFRRAGA